MNYNISVRYQIVNQKNLPCAVKIILNLLPKLKPTYAIPVPHRGQQILVFFPFEHCNLKEYD